MSSEYDVPSMYKKMLNVSHQMLSAADDEDWDKLIVLEQERAGIVEMLQATPNLIPDSQQEKDVLIGLIKEIQLCDDRVRPMILGWMAELKSMFESAGNELKLGKQYGNF